jgi:hypothetical protein
MRDLLVSLFRFASRHHHIALLPHRQSSISAMEASMRVIAALAAAALLSGCFVSEEPAFEAARGACPFAVPTSYQEAEEGAATRFVFETEGAYCKTTSDDGSEPSLSLFVPIGSNWWVVQDEGDDQTSYSMIRRTGARLLHYYPRCKDFSAARLRRLGVAFDEGRDTCTVDSAGQIETLFKSWRSPFRQAMGALEEIAPESAPSPS